MARTQDEGARLARQIDVVAVAASPDNKPRVLLAAYRLTYPLRHVALISLALDPSKLDYLARHFPEQPPDQP
jgi:hypothetical protein